MASDFSSVPVNLFQGVLRDVKFKIRQEEDITSEGIFDQSRDEDIGVKHQPDRKAFA